MSFAIEDLRTVVDKTYVGVRLNTDKVKPVHIANGLFRALLGETTSTRLIHRFVFHQKHNGEVPKGHDLDSLSAALREEGSLDPSISDDDIQDFRILLKRLVSADNGVFDKQMQSYSAGHAAFVSRDTVGQDAGEFVASWLAACESPLGPAIRSALEDDSDVLSMLCKPLLNGETNSYESNTGFSKLKFSQQALKRRSEHTMWRGMESAAITLAAQLERHPDKLFRLRMAVLFSGLVVFRHIMLLESYFDEVGNGNAMPIVMDFGEQSRSRLTDASKQSFTRCTQSIARFYAFAFGEALKKMYSAAELQKSRAPTYKQGAKKKRADNAAAELWKIKRQAAKESRNKYRVFGEAVFDILALQAEADPIRYFRALGRRLGLLYPPKGVAIPWFSPQQNLIELLVYCAVDPDEVIDVRELSKRLWDRFGIVIGGNDHDETILESHSILNWDRDSLRSNFEAFSQSLASLDFATELADGVMKVSMEAHSA